MIGIIIPSQNWQSPCKKGMTWNGVQRNGPPFFFVKHHGGRIGCPSPPTAPCDRSRHRLLWAVRWASWKGRSQPRPRSFWSKCTSTGDWTIHPVLLINRHRFSPLNPFGCLNLVRLPNKFLYIFQWNALVSILKCKFKEISQHLKRPSRAGSQNLSLPSSIHETVHLFGGKAVGPSFWDIPI